MQNYSSPQNPTVSEEVMLQRLPTFITWETLSHYSDIPSSPRLCLVGSNHWRNRKYILLQCLKKEKKWVFKRALFRFSSDLAVLWQAEGRQFSFLQLVGLTVKTAETWSSAVWAGSASEWGFLIKQQLLPWIINKHSLWASNKRPCFYHVLCAHSRRFCSDFCNLIDLVPHYI